MLVELQVLCLYTDYVNIKCSVKHPCTVGCGSIAWLHSDRIIDAVQASDRTRQHQCCDLAEASGSITARYSSMWLPHEQMCST